MIFGVLDRDISSTLCTLTSDIKRGHLKSDARESSTGTDLLKATLVLRDHHFLGASMILHVFSILKPLQCSDGEKI